MLDVHRSSQRNWLVAVVAVVVEEQVPVIGFWAVMVEAVDAAQVLVWKLSTDEKKKKMMMMIEGFWFPIHDVFQVGI